MNNFDVNNCIFYFFGAGAMGTAIIKSLVNAMVNPDRIFYTCPSGEKPHLMSLGIKNVDRCPDLCSEGETIVAFLCMKPKDVPTQLSVPPNSIVISVMAGVPLAKLHQSVRCTQLYGGVHLYRVMMNINVEVGSGIAIFATDGLALPSSLLNLFNCFGIVKVGQESDFDAYTALCGSAPAFVYSFIESLADGGVAAGLSRSTAMEFAVQVVKGSAEYLASSKKHPAELKDAICSPAGTTIAGVRALEDGCFRGTVINAVVAASRVPSEKDREKNISLALDYFRRQD